MHTDFTPVPLDGAGSRRNAKEVIGRLWASYMTCFNSGNIVFRYFKANRNNVNIHYEEMHFLLEFFVVFLLDGVFVSTCHSILALHKFIYYFLFVLFLCVMLLL